MVASPRASLYSRLSVFSPKTLMGACFEDSEQISVAIHFNIFI